MNKKLQGAVVGGVSYFDAAADEDYHEDDDVSAEQIGQENELFNLLMLAEYSGDYDDYEDW